MTRIRARHKLWLENEAGLVMSDYRVELLRHVARSGSLARAAEAMGLSYRRAWGKLREMEENLGTPLVRSEAGGPGGGQSTLTPEGQAIVAAYTRFQERANDALAALFEEELAGVAAGSTLRP